MRTDPSRQGWWSRHTRLAGVLVTAAALVVVGGGGTVVSNWVSGRDATNTAGAGQTSANQEDSATSAPDLADRPTPLSAAPSSITLHRATFANEVADVLTARTRTLRGLTPTQTTCARDALADGDLAEATLTVLPGGFTVEGTSVLVVVARHDGTRTAVAISGCSAGQPQAVIRGTLP